MHRLRILDTDPEPAFDAVVRMARSVFDVSAAAVFLVDGERQWFKAQIGLQDEGEDFRSVLCTQALEQPASVLVVADARLDPRHWNHATLKGASSTRFFAAATLSLDGSIVGALCLFDTVHRFNFGDERRADLAAMSSIVEELVRLRLEAAERRALTVSVEIRSRQLQMAEEMADLGHWSLDPSTGVVEWSDHVFAIHGAERATFDPMLDDALAFYEPESRAEVAALVDRALRSGEAFSFKANLRRSSDGARRTVLSKGEMRPAQLGAAPMLFGSFRDITEDEALLRQIEEDGERYRLLTQNATDVIAAYQTDGVLSYLSPAIEKLIGRTPAELVGLQIFDVIHPDDQARVRSELEQLVRSGSSSARIECRAMRADGVAVWVEAHPSTVYENGALVGFQDVVRDVSARKAAQLAAEESERRYRLLAENANDMVATMAPDSTVLFITPSVTRLLGYAPEAVVGRKTLSFTHPDDVPNVLALFQRLFAVGPDAPSTPYQFRGQRLDGSWVWLEGQPRVEFDAAGAPVRIQDVVRDIDARKRVEEALTAEAAHAEAARSASSASERLYRLLAENAIDIICRYGLDGVVRYISPACADVLGYTPAELIGRTILDFVHPDDRERIHAQFIDHVASPATAPIRTEHRVTRKDGQMIWLEGRPRLVRDDGGRPTEFIDVMRDVTGRKRLEDDLRAARIAAEAAVQAKSDFLANMSHELRTPLTGMLGYADVLVGSPNLNLVERRHAEMIGRAGRSLLGLVNDVLDLSKIEASGVELQCRDVDVVALMREALELVGTQAQSKSLALHSDLPLELAHVRVDPDRLRQVVLNLLSNAVKFTDEGEVRLTLSATPAPGDRLALRIGVSDSGIGIPPERLEQVFSRFEQADVSITRRFGGTGLGLSISQSLMNAMGGRVEVESAPNVGSTFTIVFEAPLCVARPEAPTPAGFSPPAVSSGPTAPPAQRPLEGVKVLLAEDVAMNRELIAIFLAQQGVDLTDVVDGLEAVKAVRAGDYDIVLMDMQMPVMGGLEAAQQIRSLHGPMATVPILALTANVLPAEIERCRVAGMDGHISKPFSAKSLTQAIEGALRDRSRSSCAA